MGEDNSMGGATSPSAHLWGPTLVNRDSYGVCVRVDRYAFFVYTFKEHAHIAHVGIDEGSPVSPVDKSTYIFRSFRQLPHQRLLLKLKAHGISFLPNDFVQAQVNPLLKKSSSSYICLRKT